MKRQENAVSDMQAQAIPFSAATELLKVQELALQWANPVLVAPKFCVAAVVGVALPLFIVTMASQSVPGLATTRASGYKVLGGFHAAAL